MNPIKKQIIIKNYGWGLRKRLVRQKWGSFKREEEIVENLWRSLIRLAPPHFFNTSQ
jgi:hypothetical protein